MLIVVLHQFWFSLFPGSVWGTFVKCVKKSNMCKFIEEGGILLSTARMKYFSQLAQIAGFMENMQCTRCIEAAPVYENRGCKQLCLAPTYMYSSIAQLNSLLRHNTGSVLDSTLLISQL